MAEKASADTQNDGVANNKCSPPRYFSSSILFSSVGDTVKEHGVAGVLVWITAIHFDSGYKGHNGQVSPR